MPRQWMIAAGSLLISSGCASDLGAATAGAAQSRTPAQSRTAARPRPGRQIYVPPSILNQANLPARVLAVHNRYRAQANVPPLQWDARLAAGALDYARQLAATGRFAHSARTTRPGQGENLWTGTAGAYPLETMLTHWGEERNQFRPGIFPNVVRFGTWQDVAHYTQMVWRGTTHVGCALHGGRGSDYLVCRYSPSGNRDGQPVP